MGPQYQSQVEFTNLGAAEIRGSDREELRIRSSRHGSKDYHCRVLGSHLGGRSVWRCHHELHRWQWKEDGCWAKTRRPAWPADASRLEQQTSWSSSAWEHDLSGLLAAKCQRCAEDVVALPGKFTGSLLKIQPAPGIGFPTVLADKHLICP